MALSPEQTEQIRQRFLEQIDRLPEEQAAQKEQLKGQIMNATAEQLEAAIKGSGGEECLFCSIAKGEAETIKLYEDNLIIAFLDISPSAAGQAIIIPKEHHQFIFQVPDQALWSIIKMIKVLEPLIVNVTAAKGMSIYISQGNAAGQHFRHLSVNLIPRFEDDKAAFYWERKEIAKHDMEKVANTITEGISKTLKEEKDRIEKILKEKQKLQEKKPDKEEKLQEFPRRRM